MQTTIWFVNKHILMPILGDCRYLAVGLLHIPCYGVFALLVRLKHFWMSRAFPDSYQGMKWQLNSLKTEIPHCRNSADNQHSFMFFGIMQYTSGNKDVSTLPSILSIYEFIDSFSSINFLECKRYTFYRPKGSYVFLLVFVKWGKCIQYFTYFLMKNSSWDMSPVKPEASETVTWVWQLENKNSFLTTPDATLLSVLESEMPVLDEHNLSL